jgi:DNA-binding MarR family transcriptional regulator
MSRENHRALIERVAWEIRAQQNATDAFDEAVCEALGINRSDHRCLDVLERHGQMTAGALAGATGLSTGAITPLLDRLERAGYVRRVRDTGDRRRVLVELTEEARRSAADLYGPLGEEACAELERCTDEQLAFLAEFARRGCELNERHIARVRAIAREKRNG